MKRTIALMALTLATLPAAAFDFNKLIDKVKEADVDKLVEVGKRVVDATRAMPEAEEIRLGGDLAIHRNLQDRGHRAEHGRTSIWRNS